MREESSPEPGLPELPDDLKTFARRLETFGPRSQTTNREQILFEAGRTAACREFDRAARCSRRTLRLWQSAALVLTAVSTGLGTTMMLRPEPVPSAVIAERDPSQLPVNERREPLRNAPSSDAIVQTKTVDPEAVHADRQPPSEMIRNRQSLMDQFLAADSRSVLAIKESESASSFADLGSSPQPLTPRSLMMGEKSRIWMNRLIEEPKL